MQAKFPVSCYPISPSCLPNPTQPSGKTEQDGETVGEMCGCSYKTCGCLNITLYPRPTPQAMLPFECFPIIYEPCPPTPIPNFGGVNIIT